jgi:hypothetical protein
MKKLVILLLSSLTFCGLSYADDTANSAAPNARDSYYPSGFYVGLNLGMAQAQMDTIPTYQTKNSGVGGRTYFGYDFNRYFSLDVGYVAFPTVKYTSDVLPTLNITNSGFDSLVTGKFPLGEGFAIYAQLGGAVLTANMTADAQPSQKANATVLAYGSGLDYVFANFGGGGLHMVLDWYHTDNKNGAPFNIPAENLYALGAYYQF